MIEADLANVAPWGFDPAQVTAPVLLSHGERTGWCPSAEPRLHPGDGHILVLNHAEAALDWLAR